MPYTPSLREIPLTEEPHASVLAAVNPESESPGDLDWSNEDAVAHVRICKQCQEFLGVDGDFAITDGTVSDEGVSR